MNKQSRILNSVNIFNAQDDSAGTLQKHGIKWNGLEILGGFTHIEPYHGSIY